MQLNLTDRQPSCREEFMELFVAVLGIIIGLIGYGSLRISVRLLDQTLELLKAEKNAQQQDKQNEK